jgi:P-type E1-E2 ATPase
VLNPFYFIELFCVVVWIAEDYTYYAVLILAAFLFSTLYNVFLVLNNFNFLSEMAGDSSLQVQILRDGQYHSHLSEELVPGDVFRLEQAVPCDCLLLEGAVVVDEREVSGDNFASKMHYDPAINPRNYTIYKGSRVISSNAAVAIASATAFSTLKGQLLRASLFPISYNFKFYREPLQFIGVLACLVVIVFFCVSSPLLKYLPGTDFALLLLDLMTLIIQPSLPLALTVGVGLSLEELQNQGILCLAPPKIVAGGNLDTIVVDST